MTTQQILQGVHDWTNGKIVYDISVAHPDGQGNPTPYADLAAALGTGGGNIPKSLRKGGMSIKFIQGTVQSSDNKYVQFRLMADEFTTDTTQWTIGDDGVLEENPEYVAVYTDAERRIVLAIDNNGNVYFGAGVPQQIIDYINEKIAELSLDEYEDIVAFLGALIEGDKTLQQLLNEKVDKVENKSLIDEDVAERMHYVENPEFISVELDVDGNIIKATKNDGTEYFGAGIDVAGVAIEKSIDNPEFIGVFLDGDGRIIMGFQKDGNVYYGISVPEQIKNYIDRNINGLANSIQTFLAGFETGTTLLEYLNDIYGEYIENPEYINVETDNDGRMLGGRKNDGTKIENLPIEIPSATICSFDDPEKRIELNTDAEKRIISHRDKDGVLHENVGIETPTIEAKITNAETVNADEINLPSEGLTELGQALINNGFYVMGFNDFSNTKNVELPEPKSYAIVNLLIPSLPIEDEDVSKGYVEYYDFSGNYFKKKCKIEPQGQSSKNFARTGGKGNYTLKIDDTIKSKVKFGSWVPQKSWHLKGCAKDVTRGYLSTSYKWAYMMMQALDASPIRTLTDDASITTTQATGDRLTDWPTDARCIPDGFPVEIYINGEYWGLYALQLQKKSENYAMDEDDYESLIIDADLLMTENSQGISVGGFWSGDIWWDKFEIRNPEPLICMDDTEYDGDDPKELIDSTSANYDANNPDHVNSAIAKGVIKGFSTKYLAVQDLIDNNNLANAKELFAQYFDVKSCILVYIFNCLTRNRDSINKNTLWGIWNNGKIVPLLWDLDCIYGEEWVGVNAAAPTSDLWTGRYAQSEWPLGQLWTLYETELKAAYASLRRNGIISVETWHDVMVKNWIERIGKEAYDRDIKKWKETPSYRKNYTNTSYWTENNTTTSPGVIQEWNNQTTYSIGDKVTLRQYDSVNSWMVYTAVAASDANNPQCPVTKFYTGFPKVGGYYNSYKRIEKWLEEQISLSDSVMGYNS